MNESVAMLILDGKCEPVVDSGRCWTCRSPHRLAIEWFVLAGATPKEIASRLPEDAKISASAIRNHWLRHVPLSLGAVQRRFPPHLIYTEPGDPPGHYRIRLMAHVPGWK